MSECNYERPSLEERQRIHQRIHEHGHYLKIIGIYEEALRKVHLNCVFNGRGRTEKGRFYLISEETAQAVDDALNHWRKEKVNK